MLVEVILQKTNKIESKMEDSGKNIKVYLDFHILYCIFFYLKVFFMAVRIELTMNSSLDILASGKSWTF